MSERIDPEDLEAVGGLEPGDPRARDAESRPRVRAQLRAYRDFMAPGDVPADARVAEAEAALRTALEREIGVPLGDDGSDPGGERVGSAHRAGRTPPSGDAGPSGWLRAMLAPGLRPALAVAALIVVAGSAWLVIEGRREEGAPVMRGDGPAASGDVLTPKPEPERLADGSLRLEWTPSREADGYAVVFLSADLEEVGRVAGLREPRLDLPPGAPPAGLESGRRVLWRAVALRGSDEVAHSPVQPVTIP